MVKSIGEKIKELRESSNLTQEELSKKLFVSKTTICQWETHKQEPSAESIIALAQLFNVRTDYIFGLEDETGSKTNPKYSIGSINNNGNGNVNFN